MGGDLLGVLAFGIVVVTGVAWFRLIKAVRIPSNRLAFFAAMGVGVVLGIAAFGQGTGVLGGLAAGFAILAGGVFLGLRLQSTQDAREPAVRVGGRILDFSAPDERGEPFDLASLRGRPYLLKFFRGHW
jgi:cytochrome oxidase Cu insertion factor (SCO1/SenC/PrrC family)